MAAISVTRQSSRGQQNYRYFGQALISAQTNDCRSIDTPKSDGYTPAGQAQIQIHRYSYSAQIQIHRLVLASLGCLFYSSPLFGWRGWSCGAKGAERCPGCGSAVPLARRPLLQFIGRGAFARVPVGTLKICVGRMTQTAQQALRSF